MCHSSTDTQSQNLSQYNEMILRPQELNNISKPLPCVWWNKALSNGHLAFNLRKTHQSAHILKRVHVTGIKRLMAKPCEFIPLTREWAWGSATATKDMNLTNLVAPTHGGCHLDLEMRGEARAFLLRQLTLCSTNWSRVGGRGTGRGQVSEGH